MTISTIPFRVRACCGVLRYPDTSELAAAIARGGHLEERGNAVVGNCEMIYETAHH
jgi:hypothetical protein